MEKQLKLPKYENWSFSEIYDLYERYKNLEKQEKLTRRQRSKLENIINILKNYDFASKLSHYRCITKKISWCEKEENYEKATELKKEAEEFKAHFLD